MLIDLSHPFSADMPVFPGDPKPKFKKIAEIESHGFEQHEIRFSNHHGTHIDAPSHMIKGGKTLNDFPLETFTGKGILIDVRNHQTLDIELLEKTKLEPASIVLFWTNHDRYLPMATKNLAEMLVKAKVKMVGFDTPSPDIEPFEFHKIVLAHDILILENLTNLAALASKNFAIFAFPLKMSLNGSPVRVVAACFSNKIMV